MTDPTSSLREYFAAYAALHESAAEVCMRSAQAVSDPERVRALVSLAAVNNGVAWAFRDAAGTGTADAIDELSDVVLSWVVGERVAPAADAPHLLAADPNAE